MHRSRLEVLVGLFVILSLVTLSFMVFFISGVYVFKKGYTVNVLFNYVSNLEKGAMVRLAGIPVGNVTSLAITMDPKLNKQVVKTTLFIDEGVEIRANDRIRLEGIYGLSTPHLEIKAANDPNSQVLKDGDTLIGVDPVPIDDLIGKGEIIAGNLEETIMRFNKFIGDEKMMESMNQIILNLNEITTSLSTLMKEREGDFGKTIDQLEEASGHLNSVMEKLDRGEGTAGKLLSDEALYKELESFVKDIKRHPWKLMKKGKEADEEEKKRLGII